MRKSRADAVEGAGACEMHDGAQRIPVQQGAVCDDAHGVHESPEALVTSTCMTTDFHCFVWHVQLFCLVL